MRLSFSINLSRSHSFLSGCIAVARFVELFVGEPMKVHTDTSYTCGSQSVQKDTLRSIITNCDSVVNITYFLNKNVIKRDTITRVICQGEHYTLPSGSVVSIQGTHQDTVRYAAGCDSLITRLYLYVNPLYVSNSQATLCASGSMVLPSGATVTKPGIYNDTIRYVKYKCDSLVSKVVVTQIAVKNERVEIPLACETSYTLPTGVVVTTSGDYLIHVPSRFGCDSVLRMYHVDFARKGTTMVTKTNDVSCSLQYTRLTASGGSSYEWSPSVESPNSATTIAKPTEPTTYKVKITDGKCVYYDSIKVNVTKGQGAMVEMPNAFTPNGDGKNDCFPNTLGNLTDLRLEIYNRWGEMVWSTTNPGECWDGTYKGEKQGTSAFVYRLHATSFCGTVDQKGTVVLIR